MNPGQRYERRRIAGSLEMFPLFEQMAFFNYTYNLQRRGPCVLPGAIFMSAFKKKTSESKACPSFPVRGCHGNKKRSKELGKYILYVLRVKRLSSTKVY